MYGVIIALLPAFLVSIFYFGLGMIIITATAVISCVLFEFLIQRYLLKKKSSISDGSAIVTGILIAFCLPSNIPLWLVVLGSLVAIGVGKMSFGGLGTNPFNPALVGRVFLFISFPVHMTSWPEPIINRFVYTDAATGATPLSIVQNGLKGGDTINVILPRIPDYMDMLLGKMGGSAGEVAAAALLLGFSFLLIRKIITWHIPVSFLASFGILVFLFGGLRFGAGVGDGNVIFHFLSGGLFLGAFYMATDMVTSPLSRRGMIIFGVGIGFFTFLIRFYGSFPEGVSLAIILMNVFVPFINRYTKPRRFGVEAKS